MCKRKYNHQYRIDHLDEEREHQRQRYAAHHERAIELHRKQYRRYHAAHLDEERERLRKWRTDHPEKRREQQHKYRATHLDKIQEKHREYNTVHRDEMNERNRKNYVADKNRAQHLRKKYNLSPDEYQAMLSNQNGKCIICGRNHSEKPLAVDHDHVSGKVRGLLCRSCNAGLGIFKDSIPILLKAIEYLRSSMSADAAPT